MADGTVVARAVLVAALAMQAAFAAWQPREWRAEQAIGAPPNAQVATLAAWGETRGAAYALSLVLQSFDTQAGEQQRLRAMRHDDTIAWLARAGEIAPSIGYDTFLATRIYGEVVPAVALRPLLAWVQARHAQAPDAHWTSLAHAVWIAGHRLGDKPLAADLARSLRERAGASVPTWALQMEGLLRADLDELDAARLLIGAMLDSGAITDAREQELLTGRLREAERRRDADGRHPPSIEKTR